MCAAVLQIHTCSGDHLRPLVATTLLGRHAQCTWPFGPPLLTEPLWETPAFWLELRWFPEQETWGARRLAGEMSGGRRSSRMASGWVELPPGESLAGGDARVELIGEGAPDVLVSLPRLGQALTLPQLDRLLVERDDGWWPLECPGAGPGGPLQDGELFVTAGEVYRFHAPPVGSATRPRAFDILAPGLMLLRRETPSAPELRLFQRGRSLAVVQRHSALLAVYFDAVLQGDGWVYPTDVQRTLRRRYDRHLDVATVSTYRRRLVDWLQESGVAHAEQLFDVESRGPESRARLALGRDALRLEP